MKGRKNMAIKFHDIVVPREYESKQDGKTEKKTYWSKVGRAWTAKSGESMSFELFLIPGVRYSISLKDRENDPEKQSEEAPF